MFGRMFSIFNPGNRGGTIAPQPIILATAGVRIATAVWTGTEINTGAARTIVPGVPGFYLVPLAFTSIKNIVTIHAPTNTTFTLRYVGLVASVGSGLTPQVVSLGSRTDQVTNYAVSVTSPNVSTGRGLEIFPNAVNGGGSVNNRVHFTLAYMICNSHGILT